MPNNIIFSFFGYDEADIINHNYAYRSVWVDDNQDKSHLYALSSNSVIIDNIWVFTINSYDFFKKFIKDNTADDESLIRETRGCMYKMISEAEKIKAEYREYINKTITEEKMAKNIRDNILKVRKLYLQQSNLPIATKNKKMYNWQLAYSNLATAIDNLAMCYSDYNLKNRNSKDRQQLFEIYSKEYNKYIEKIKSIDINLIL